MQFPPWRKPRVPVLRLHGILASKGPLNIEAIGPLVDRAFRGVKRGGTVLLDIDSRGGSPVHSELIATRIRRRADETGARVRAVIGEVGASGGYWLACAADEIVAHPLSIVGSIGVIGGGFGLHDAIARIGVERRVYTAGRNKARLDPFSPERPEDVAFTKRLLEDLHARFKDWVRSRRAGRLRADEEEVFDGSWMLGEKALAAGLVDRLGDLEAEVKAVGGDKARPQVIRPRRRSLLSRLPRMTAEAAVDVLAERLEDPRARLRL
ncbi:MAG: S49 family peptidase [Acetobacteraceae bacterium]|nr:S49 family peptidase [Acetobacteraceae bacterium]